MAVNSEKSLTASISRQYCTFRIDTRLYGIDILDVKEINPMLKAVPIYHAPAEVTGFINVRGQIYLLLDLRLMLGFEANDDDSAGKVILFKTTVGEHFGILVDSIEDMVSVNEEDIEQQHEDDHESGETDSPQSGSIREGVCTLEKELLVIIKANQLLPIIDHSIERHKQHA